LAKATIKNYNNNLQKNEEQVNIHLKIFIDNPSEVEVVKHKLVHWGCFCQKLREVENFNPWNLIRLVPA